MDVSIIIVNYNTTELLLNCISSIYDNTSKVDFEVLVVDNNSISKPKNIINDKFPEVIYIQSNVNLGFGKANNLGVLNSKGKYIFFLNSDTILLNNVIFIFHSFLETTQNKNIAGVGGNLFTIDKNENFSYSTYFPSIFRIILYRSKLHKIIKSETFNVTNLPKQVSIIIGADLFIKKEIFNFVGGFDPKIFMYIEDGDLQYQLNKLGYIFYNLPQAEIIHLQGASSTTGEKMIMEIKSYHYYFKKNTNKRYTYLYILIEFLFAFCFYIIFIILNNKIKKSNYFTLLQFIYNEYLFAKNIK